MLTSLATLALASLSANDAVRIDRHATLRWQATGKEISLFGANYCLPSALDFRAAKATGVDLKALVRQDMTHFRRMGWDGLRFSFWGDWESSDRDGNLVTNEHLDLMDYVLAEGAKRGIKFLLSPIVTYDARWPEMKEYPAAHGFSRSFEKGKLGTDAEAIKVQQNYLRQLLNHVNPYTGRAWKSEPSVLFIEMINEPAHHAADVAGSARYIDALVQAVRDTGCTKPTFHNLSQDFRMLRPIMESKVDGLTFGWYPTGLNANHALHGNVLRYVDHYGPMQRPEAQKKPSLVYEFDMPDTDTAYAYPAMVREFRAAGAQYAAMFSYDMLATAPMNLGWTTHLLNMVYTPKKAASAIIAAEAMRKLPRFKAYGEYPANKSFGPVQVDDLRDQASYADSSTYLYANGTIRKSSSLKTLVQIAGTGSSPLVRYEGNGLYFLDKLNRGLWRLEVYPDVVELADPFRDPKLSDKKFTLVGRSRKLSVSLPDLGQNYSLNQIAGFNQPFKGSVTPGVYILRSRGNRTPLPKKFMGDPVANFVCPEPTTTDRLFKIDVPDSPVSEANIDIQILRTKDINQVSAVLGSKRWPARKVDPYHFTVKIPRQSGSTSTVQILADKKPLKTVRLSWAKSNSPLTLFDAKIDTENLAFSRSGEAKISAESLASGMEPGTKALPLRIPTWLRTVPDDLTASHFAGKQIKGRQTDLPNAKSLTITLRGRSDYQAVHITLVDKEGNAWSAEARADAEWVKRTIPLSEFKSARWAMLPQAYPGTWSYWCDSLPGKKLDLRNVERVQFSLRKDDLGDRPREGLGVEIQSLSVNWGA